MTKERALELIGIYGRAWETRNPELILDVFTADATYDDPHELLASGHDGIREYWKIKVVGEQDDIHFELLNLWLDGETVIAEWRAKFVDVKRQLRLDMKEVAIFGVDGDRFSSLREYYKSMKTAL